MGKVHITPPHHLSAIGYLTPQPIKPDILHPNFFKTGQITPSSGFRGGFIFFLFRMNYQKIIVNYRKIIK